jgi:tetratricopeptide (TPR) repeat protein
MKAGSTWVLPCIPLLCLWIVPERANAQGGSVWENYRNAATDAFEEGNLREAERLLQEALAEASKPGQNPGRIYSTLQALGDLYFAAEQYDAAADQYNLLLEQLSRSIGPEHPGLALPLRGLAKTEQIKRRYREAERLYRRSLTMTEKGSGAAHPNVAAICEDLAGLYIIQKRYSEAESLFRRSLLIWEQTYGPEDPKLAAPLNNLAGVYSIEDNFSEAEPLYQRAIKNLERSYGPENTNLVAIMANYAALLRKAERTAEAAQMEARVSAIHSRRAVRTRTR